MPICPYSKTKMLKREVLSGDYLPTWDFPCPPPPEVHSTQDSGTSWVLRPPSVLKGERHLRINSRASRESLGSTSWVCECGYKHFSLEVSIRQYPQPAEGYHPSYRFVSLRNQSGDSDKTQEALARSRHTR